MDSAMLTGAFGVLIGLVLAFTGAGGGQIPGKQTQATSDGNAYRPRGQPQVSRLQSFQRGLWYQTVVQRRTRTRQ